MGEALRRRLKQSRFRDPIQEAVLNLLVTSSHVRELFEKAYVPFDLTLGQYNALRILRGAHPEGYPRCEVLRRMVERSPDITRMMDRLETRGLVERDRSAEDRRLSITRITEKGIRLLDRVQPVSDDLIQRMAERISSEDALHLSRICEGIYGPDLEPAICTKGSK